MRHLFSRLLALCLTVCLCLTATAATLPDGTTPLTESELSAAVTATVVNDAARTYQNRILVTNRGDKAVSLTVYSALYGPTGRFLGAGSQSLSVPAKGEATATVTLTYAARSEGCVQRIYLWDASQRPLAQPLAVRDVIFETTPAALTLSPSEVTLWKKGDGATEPFELQAVIEPAGAVDQRVNWTSSDPAVATVDRYGCVTPQGRGEAVITASTLVGGITQTARVTVKQAPAALTFGEPEWDLLRRSEDLVVDPQLTLQPADADWPDILWSSSDETVAVPENGKIRAMREGTAVITARAAHDPRLAAHCTVTVRQAVTGLTLDHTELHLWDDMTYALQAVIEPADAHATVKWSSSDPAVASVDDAGLVTAHKTGTATLTASAGGQQAVCEVHVYHEMDYIGQVCAKYESTGDPGTVSSGAGDKGGKSYGAYQLASLYNGPLEFAKWLTSSGENPDWGQRLETAYHTNGDGFGPTFDATWKAIAAEDRAGFLLAQQRYTQITYYDVAVASIKKNIGLDVNTRSFALKCAIWSRSVQHGAGGTVRVLTRAFEAIGGYQGKTDEELIRAIYAECGMAIDPPAGAERIVTSERAKQYVDDNGNYLVYGKVVKYFSGSSGSVQFGVWVRLNINELADLMALLETLPVPITD